MGLLRNILNGRGVRPLARDDEYTIGENDSYIARPQLNDDANTLVSPYQKKITSATSVDYLGTVSIINNGDFLQFDNGPGYDYLAIGETATAEVSYTIRNAFGQWHGATISLTIVGQNDAPVAQDVLSLTSEDAGVLLAADFTDPDLADTHSFSHSNAIGTITNNGDGTFIYDPSGQFEYLAVGETATDSFTYTVTDNHGAADTATATVTIEGVNDAVVIETADNGEVIEDNSLEALRDNGTISFTDLDHSDVHSAAVAFASTSHGSQLGSTAVSLDADTTGTGTGGSISWNYNVSYDDVQFLGGDDTITEIWTVTIDDGNGGAIDHDIVVTIRGVNDAATFAGDDTGAVEEDGTFSAAGTLTTADMDAGETGFAPASPAALTGIYGDFTFDEATGEWTYALRNSDANVQALSAGETVIDTLTVAALDGTTHDVSIAVTGDNDLVSAQEISATAPEDGPAVDLASAIIDPDANDIHSYSFTAPADFKGALVSDGAGGFSYDANGQFEWLALGETATETFSYTVDDNAGSTDSATATITIEGANDAVTANDDDISAVISSVGHPLTGADSYVTAQHNGTFLGSIPLGDAVHPRIDGMVFDHLHGILDRVETYVDIGPLYTGGGRQTLYVTEFEESGGDINPTNILFEQTLTFGGSDPQTLSYMIGETGLEAGDPYAIVVRTEFVPNGYLWWGGRGGASQIRVGPEGDELNGRYFYAHSSSSDLATVFAQDFTESAGTDLALTITYSDIDIIYEDEWGTFDVLANDTDPDVSDILFVQSVSDTALGLTPIILGDSTVTYDPRGVAVLQQLNAGDVIQDSFTYVVSDGNGSTDSATVTFDVHGLNDEAAISGTIEASVAEDDNTQANFGATVSDVDDGEAYFASVADPAGQFGDFILSSDGLGWTYELDLATARGHGVAAGETLTDTLTVHSSDGTASTVLTVSVSGVNDEIVVTGGDFAETGIESNIDPETVLTGAIQFDDADLSDTHDVSISFVSSSRGDQLGALTQILTDTTGTGTGGLIDWHYAVSSDDLRYLNEGDQITETYSVTITDNHGSTESRDITVTLVGVDSPPVAVDDDFGQTNEDTNITFAVADFLANDTDPDGGAPFAFDSIDATSAYGAAITMPDAETVNYDPSALQALGQGESLSDTITYTIATQTGFSSSATISVLLNGVNDAANLTGGDFAGAANEGSDANVPVTTSGTILFDGIDAPDTHTVTASFKQASRGTQEGAMNALLVTDTTGTGTGGVIGWTYAIDNAFIFDLTEGETITETYTFTITDNHGLETLQDVTVTVTGVDSPALAADDAVTGDEDSVLVIPIADLLINDTDPDGGAGIAPVFAGADALTALGHAITVDATNVTFDPTTLAAFQALQPGETLTDSFDYMIDVDGQTSSATVEMTITGADDAPTITGGASVVVVEDGTQSSSNRLFVSDADHDESGLVAQAQVQKTYGYFSVVEDGSWSYTLTANDSAQVQGLGNQYETLTETHIVTSLDGTAQQTITATIKGAPDSPVANPDVFDANHSFSGFEILGDGPRHGYLLNRDHGPQNPDFYNKDGFAQVYVAGSGTLDKLNLSTYKGGLSIPEGGINLSIYEVTINAANELVMGNLLFGAVALSEELGVARNQIDLPNLAMTPGQQFAVLLEATTSEEAPAIFYSDEDIMPNSEYYARAIGSNTYEYQNGRDLLIELIYSDSGVVAEDGVFTFHVDELFANDFDADGDTPLSLFSFGDSQAGATVTYNSSNGTITYDASAGVYSLARNELYTDTISYRPVDSVGTFGSESTFEIVVYGV